MKRTSGVQVEPVAQLLQRGRELDAAVYGKLTSVQSRSLDQLVPPLTRAADHSLLWLAISGGLALFGDRRGRRAALRGVLSIGLASGLVNLVLKRTWRRSRPVGPRAPLVRRPRSFSFPSGHTASAFAFATGAGLEIPLLLPPLAAAALAIGYARVHGRVHHPSDVLAGAGIGVGAGLASRPIAAAVRRLGGDLLGEPSGAAESNALRAVLVLSPHAGRVGQCMPRVRESFIAHRVEVAYELDVKDVSQLPDILRSHGAEVVLAAGGDGTVGAVADQIASSGSVLGILPLGTSNDFARSLGIPMRVEEAVRLLRTGKVSTVDLGRVEAPGQRSRHFVHAATAGLNVSFAKLATRASLRRRFGRLTYVVAGAIAVRHRKRFHCRLSYSDRSEEMLLTHLSVINAPIFGGFLGMRVTGSSPDDRLLDVLAVEELTLQRAVLAGLYQLFRIKRPLKGVRALHVNALGVETQVPLEITLDGEVAGRLPSTFTVAGEALQVITPRVFKDVDDT